MKNKLLFLSFICFTILSFGQKTVSINGTSYETISAAITDANSNDVIVITGIHTESIVVVGKSLTLRGTNPTTDIIQAAASASTDASGSRVVNLSGTATITIENLGIRYGNNSANGAGINVDKVTGQVTLKNLIVENNYTSSNGGGLAIAGSNVNIIGCTIKSNTSSLDGGGMFAVPNNAAGVNSVVNLEQSLVDSNTGRNGGGIYINGNIGFGNNYTIDVNVENSTVSNNSASSASGAAGGGAVWCKVAQHVGASAGVGNINLKFVHATVYNNTHEALVKSGLLFTGTAGVTTNFSAYNSIIVSADDISIKAISFAKANLTDMVNCILGGLDAAAGANPIIDDAVKNNEKGKTATFAGISGGLTSVGGLTQVLTMNKDENFKNYCTAATGITLPTGDQRGYLRGTTPDAGAFEYYNIWTGASSTDWATAGNWEDGLPTTGDVVQIKTAGNMPTASAAIDVANIIMDSGTSLITSSSYAGNLVYNRNLATTNWYLVSSPVSGQDEDDFIAESNFAYGTGNNRGFATYNTANDSWTYYSGTETANVLTQGTGYSVKKNSVGNISFSGNLLTSDLTPISLTTSNNGFNLVGNPYPSYINSETMLDLASNSDALSSKTIWVWDQSLGTYDAKASTEAFKIAPGQAFFVKSDGAAGSLSINESFQSHESSDTFLKSVGKTKISLQLTSENQTRVARLYYVDNATDSFDNGYDAPLFTGIENPFAIYSHLSSLEQSEDLQVQSVGNTDMENIIIPIGINAKAGSTIKISANSNNLPSNLKVFLEDREANSTIELNDNSSYTTLLSSEVKGSGRFYLHTKSSVLSVGQDNFNTVQLYSLNHNRVKISGINENDVVVKVFNILGAEVYANKLNILNHKILELPNTSQGVFIVKLETSKGNITKKIILKN
ncbi:T9SS type A sorting domain-containing protein [Polaribacter sp.]|uniref:T9SS type A sorting domain-containing protein n=1 Tax=Polaribacter sp. TaxID=1920175 RepID=UPI003F6A4B07